ncbi:MAG: glycosyltransferase 87 family protein [Nakamurella sp.]
MTIPAISARAWYGSPARLAGMVLAGCLLSVAIALTASTWLDQYDLGIYNSAIRWWRSGHDLYGYAQSDPLMGSLGFTYPPAAAVLMWPMTLFGFPALQTITLVGILVAGVAVVALVLRAELPASVTGKPFAAAIAVVTPLAFALESWRQNLSFGQINLFLAVLVAADLLWPAAGRPKWAGIGVGLATALKITPGIFLVQLAICRRWRELATAVATAIVTTGLAAIFLPADTWRYFSQLLWDTSRVGTMGSVQNQSIRGWAIRLFGDDGTSKTAWAVLAVVVVVVGFREVAALATTSPAGAMAVTGLIGVLIAPVSWMHHAVWVFPALVVLIHRWWQLRDDGMAGRLRIGIAALIVLGLLSWGIHPGSYLDRVDDWTTAGAFSRLVSGIPTIWCLLVVLFARWWRPARITGSRPLHTGAVTSG